jgi:hypothetical protein
MVQMIAIHLKLNSWLSKRVRDDRGDVPGWVLVVLMTAGLVTGIWALAGPKLTQILMSSLDAISTPIR